MIKLLQSKKMISRVLISRHPTDKDVLEIYLPEQNDINKKKVLWGSVHIDLIDIDLDKENVKSSLLEGEEFICTLNVEKQV